MKTIVIDRRPAALTTSFSRGAKNLKERFESIMLMKAKNSGIVFLALIMMIAVLASCGTGLNINKFDWTLYTNTEWRCEEGDADLYFKDKGKGIIFDLYVSQMCIVENVETAGKLKTSDDGYVDTFDGEWGGSSIKANITFSPDGDYVIVTITETVDIDINLGEYKFVKASAETPNNIDDYYGQTIDGWLYYQAGDSISKPVIMRKNINTGEEQELVRLNGMPSDGHCAWGLDAQTKKIYYFLFRLPAGAGEAGIAVEREGGYSCNLDGSGQQFLFEANNVVNTSVSQLLIIDGYFYFTSNCDGSQNLYRLKIDGSSTTMIYEGIITPYPFTNLIWQDGNFIYFRIFYDEENNFRLAKYNLTSQKVEDVSNPNESIPPWENQNNGVDQDELPSVPEESADSLEVFILRLDKEIIAESELRVFTEAEMEYVLNGIYALSGYKFNSPDLFNYFSSKDWYKPIDNNMDAARGRFNSYQTQNFDIILGYMQSKGWR